MGPAVKRTALNVPLCLLSAAAIGAAILAPAHGAWHGPDGPYHQWFVGQMQEPPDLGPCCGDEEHYGGDGRYVDVKTLPGGQYEVFVREAGTWIVYPKTVNPSYPNPTGQNVAWYLAYKIPDSDGHAHWDVKWFCLRLAQGM